MRYIRQRDESSCGPIAIMNAMKWAGKKFAAKDVEQQIKKDCFYFPANIDGPLIGVLPMGLDIALKKNKGIKVEEILEVPTISDINKYLDQGHAIILRYLHGKAEGHYVLCIGRTDKTYTLVNYSRTKTISRITKRTMERLLYHTVLFFAEVNFCVAWVIKKNKIKKH